MKSMKMENDIRICAKTMPVDPERKERSMLLLQEAIEKKQMGMLCNRKKHLYQQIKYMDKSLIAAHALACVFLLLLLAALKSRNAKMEQIILFSVTFSGILGVVTIGEVGRIFYAGIAELSESCYFNAKQIVAFHMLLSGIFNLTFLSFGILFVGYQWKMSFVQAGLYLLVPFVIAQSVCLKVLLSESGRRNAASLPAAGAILVICYLSLSMLPELYQTVMLAAWGIAFLIGLLILTIQVKLLFQKIEKGEILCTN